MTADTDMIALFVEDMFFVSKISSAAAVCGRKIERIKSTEQLEKLTENPPSLILIDLNSDRLDPVQTIAFLKSREKLKEIPIISFVSHVQTDLINAARTAGCDYVLPRSVFTQSLNETIAGDFSSIDRFRQD